ncbi:MAG: 4Fe-4S dicluster domain-containing protein [Candidatus Alcyoniella australis]|nr:4Fe-4S dicluster domain-containing protein [Candidatus Alcyoniella australis]
MTVSRFHVEPLDPQKVVVADEILDTKFPPVARFRLLSRGIEPYHRLDLREDSVDFDQGCVACGNCIDSCPVLRRETERVDRTGQRTSMALETLVDEDCEQCWACVLSCPQVDTELKDYIVDERVEEMIPPNPLVSKLDNYFMVLAALAFGIMIGIFIVW